MATDKPDIHALFNEAAARNSPEERSQYLDEACGSDPKIRERVEALLRAHSEAGGFFGGQSPASAITDLGPITEQPGTVIGPYKLLQQLGEGGMGTVFMAEQSEPVQRKVALKVIKPGMDSRQVIARFEAERQALALMDHPNIAKVLDAGATASGRPYFVMELVKGISITKYCDQEHLAPKDRLELFIPVCQAVQHAHQKGIIHRDLKPSNVLIALYDGHPVPKVIDFGVAKATAQKLTERTMYTAVGQIIGTLEYMAPEQAELNNLDIDTRADVYSLGAMLYELLTGSPPFTAEQLRNAALGEMLRTIREDDPPKPSARVSSSDAVSSIAAVRRLEPKHLTRLLRGDLDWIAMKCLEKERGRRYETANGLAEDIQHYLASEPVHASPPSAGYRFQKFLRRNKGSVIAVSLVVLAVLGGIVGTSIGMVQAQRARSAEAIRETAEKARWDRNADAVKALLDQCEEALRAGDAAKAAVTLESAQKRAVEGGTGELANRQDQLQADLAALRSLSKVDQIRWIPVAGHLPDARLNARRYREALRPFDLVPESTAANEAAARVSRSAVRDRLVAALDQWLLGETLAWVREVLRMADPNPYRDEVRDAVLANEGARLAYLTGRPAAAGQPPSFVAFLGETGASPIKRRRELLAFAVRHEPGDLSLLMTLGDTYPNNQKDGAEERLRWYQAAVGVARENLAAHTNLGVALSDKGDLDGAIGEYKEAIRIDPKVALPHGNLGVALAGKGQVDEAISSYRKAIELDPQLAMAHSDLGDALNKGRLDEAITSCRKAVELDPKNALFHSKLGEALNAKGQLDEAIATFRKVIELDPKGAMAHIKLGAALNAKGQLDEAIACFRKAIVLDPMLAMGYRNLGTVLGSKGQLDAAFVAYRKAIELDPKDVDAYNGLGAALMNNGRLDEAITSCRKAIELAPRNSLAHCNLGVALRGKDKLDEAIAAFHKGIELDPKDADAHNGLGEALNAKGQLDEAMASFRRAIELAPKDADTHGSLGLVLLGKGQFDEAIASFRKASELDPKNAAAQSRLEQAQRMATVQDKFAAFRKGDFKPTTNDQRLALSELCTFKKLYRTSAGLYADVFAADPKLADDLGAGRRYNAACYASLAASGQGKDAAKLDDTEKTRLRKQAFDWLLAELAVRRRQLESGQQAERTAAQQALQHWQQDSDLAGLRDEVAVVKLPVEVRATYKKLWAEVAALVKKSESESAKVGKP